MTTENNLDPQKMEQGKLLTKKLFNYKEAELLKLSDAKKQELRAEYPLLTADEFHNVIVLVLDAKRRQQKLISLQTLPKNLSIILISLLSWILGDWKIASIIGAFSLLTFILFSNWLNNSRLARYVNIIGWLSYAATFAFGAFLYWIGAKWNIAILGAAALWVGALFASWLAILILGFLQSSQKEE